MDDELYALFLDTFVMKLAGASPAEIGELLQQTPTMQQRAVVALALAGACRSTPALVSRESLATDINMLLKVQ